MQKTVIMTTMVAAMFLLGPAAALDVELKNDQAESGNSTTYVVGSAGDVAWHDYSAGEGIFACDGTVGWLCFDVSGDDEVTLVINDDSTLDAGAYIAETAQGVCGSAILDVSEIDQLNVFMIGPVFHAVDGCLADGVPATSGTVSVSPA